MKALTAKAKMNSNYFAVNQNILINKAKIKLMK